MKKQRVTITPRYERTIVYEGDCDVIVQDLRTYVQVEFAGSSGSLYTYVDPGLNLQVGDIVDVPTRIESHNLAIVCKLGDGYNGKAERCVLGRYTKDPIPVAAADVIAEQERDYYNQGFVLQPRMEW